MKRAFLIVITSYFVTGLWSQPSPQWVRSHNGSGNSLDYGRALQVDAAGNAYVAGTSTNSGTAKDITVIKYDIQGNQLWVANWNGSVSLDDWGYGIAVDASGNSYAAGFTTTSGAGKDFVVVKFDPAGQFLWASQYNGPASLDDAANHITVDPQGNVIIAGISKGSGTMDDYATVKYDPSGNQLWVRRYDGPVSDVDDARTIACDKWGNIYVSGGSTGNGTGYDFLTVKYDAAGNQKWAARYDGPESAYDLVYYQGSVKADTLGNVYITGYSTGPDSTLDYATVKYDSLGNQLWVARFFTDSGGTDYADAIHVDEQLNVYVTGGSYRQPNDFDLATVKYNAQGVQQWVAHYNGTGNSWDEAYGVVTDDSLNVYTLGRSPGASSNADFVIVKYSPSGAQVWDARYANSGYDWPFSIRFYKPGGCLYAAGNLSAPSFSDMGVIKYCQYPVGMEEVPVGAGPEIYPNPNAGFFSISGLKGPVTVEISGLAGEKILLEENVISGVSLPVNAGDGIYMVRIISKEGVIVKKVMVTKGR